MPLEIFIKLDGITGESKNHYFKGWSEIISWEWGMTQVVKEINSSRKYVPHFKELTIKKLIGMDSPHVMQHFAENKPIKRVELSIIPIVGKREARQKYVSLTMENVQVKSMTTGGNTEDTLLSEDILFRFSRFQYQYTQNLQGSSNGTKPVGIDHEFGWDVKKSEGWKLLENGDQS